MGSNAALKRLKRKRQREWQRRRDGRAVERASGLVTRNVMVSELHMRTCCVCGRSDPRDNIRTIEDRMTREGLIACGGAHHQIARYAMHRFQRETHGHATVLVRPSPRSPFAPCESVPVRFYRKSIDAVQEATIHSPAYLSYCRTRGVLRILGVGVDGGGDGDTLCRLVSVANLRHYNRSLDWRHVYPTRSFGTASKEEVRDCCWKRRWHACAPTAPPHEPKPFDC